MTTLPDAADTDTGLDLPAVLDPTLTLSDGVLEIAYQYALSDLLGDAANDSVLRDTLVALSSDCSSVAQRAATKILTPVLGKPGTANAIRLATACHALQTSPWTISDAGALAITGSDGTTTYVVDATVCVQKGVYRTSKKGKVSPALCKGWQFAGGACYHRVAFELLRIAQTFELL